MQFVPSLDGSAQSLPSRTSLECHRHKSQPCYMSQGQRSRRRSPTRRPPLPRHQVMPTRIRRSDMNQIEECLSTLSAAPPLRPRPSLDTMTRRASTYRLERRRRHLGGVGIVALLLGGGTVAGLGLASPGGLPRPRVANITVPCPGPLARIDKGRVLFAPGRSLVFAGTVLGGSGTVHAKGQTILLSPLKVMVSHYFRGTGPATLRVDNHVTFRNSVLYLPQFGWGFAVGQHRSLAVIMRHLGRSIWTCVQPLQVHLRTWPARS